MSTNDRYADDEIDLVHIYQVLREEWKILVGVTAAFAVGAVIYALLATPYYRAEAVVVEVGEAASGRSAMLGQLGGLASLAGIDASSLSGANPRKARALLKSRGLAEEYIRRNDLIPVLLPDTSEGRATIWNATDGFVRNVWSVREDARTGVITVSVEWTDAEVAAEWANGMVQLGNELLRSQDIADAERSIEYLNEQVARTNVVGIQQALFNLIEAETRTLTLANARQEYAFAVVDPAVAPERKARPRRGMVVFMAIFFGGIFGLGIVAGQRFLRRVRTSV